MNHPAISGSLQIAIFCVSICYGGAQEILDTFRTKLEELEVTSWPTNMKDLSNKKWVKLRIDPNKIVNIRDL